MELHELRYSPGSRRPRKRRGRGPGSGRGGTAGRGEKGQKARSGGKVRLGFEGGQMPLVRRLPKVGFTSPQRKSYSVVNISALNRFPNGTEVTPELLQEERIIRSLSRGVKVLGDGILQKKLVVWAHRFSQKASQAIEEAGGSCHHIATAEKK